MAITDSLIRINDLLSRQREKAKTIEARRSSQSRQTADRAQAERNKAEAAKQQWYEFEDQVMVYYRMAKNNTDRELTILTESAEKPDKTLNKLDKLVRAIHPNNYHDPNADKAVELAGRYVAYIRKQIMEIDASAARAIASSESDGKSKQETLGNELRGVVAECNSIVGGSYAKAARQELDGIARSHGVTAADISRWEGAPRNAGRGENSVLYGYCGFKLKAPKPTAATIKKAFGSHAAGNVIKVPLVASLFAGGCVSVEYPPECEAAVGDGIRAMILDLVLHVETSDYKISVIDGVHYGSGMLGQFAPLTSIKSGSFERPPANDDEAKKYISRLGNYYQSLETRIGADTLESYNNKSDKKMPARILVIVRNAGDYGSFSGLSGLSYLVNNASRFGIHVFELLYDLHPDSSRMNKSASLVPNSSSIIRITGDKDGRFWWVHGERKSPFVWSKMPKLPVDFIDKVKDASSPKEIGTRYFARYKMTIPKRSVGARKPIEVPFAIDADDRPITCSFEGDNFAAYIMGSAGSGKSTLLHTIIDGLLMGYHPDEVELWLVDFKKTEFRKYSDYRPPHVRYLLLEQSEEVLFDLIDELLAELSRRENAFANNKWSKLTEVPPAMQMPALFVIIDEFAQVSQQLASTKGMGVDGDYSMKLENLLAKGRALGFKFIFASQTYTTGVTGLTETARKQIQLRIALKSTDPQEIKQTLGLMPNQYTDDVLDKIASIQQYESIYKRANPNGGLPVIDLYRNMYLEEDELAKSISLIASSIKPGKGDSDAVYVDKHPVFLVDDRPLTYSSLIPAYKEFSEKTALHRGYSDVDDDDMLLHIGTPCSFAVVRPAVLRAVARQNIMIVGGSRDDFANVLLSLLRSWNRYDKNLARVEIWANPRSPLFKRYKKVWARCRCITETADMLARLEKLGKIHDGSDRLVVCMDLGDLVADFDGFEPDEEQLSVTARSSSEEREGPDLLALMSQIKNGQAGASDIAAYNESVEKEKAEAPSESPKQQLPKDGRLALDACLKKGPKRGLHFVATFSNAADLTGSRLPEAQFQHRIVFPMSRQESHEVLRNAAACELTPGTFLYTDGRMKTVLRTHIHPNIPCNGWILRGGKMERYQ